jgi:hypothetical protein
MYGKVKGKKIKRRSSLIENTLVVLVGVMCFFLAGAAHERGIAVKWVTALFATAIPFLFVIYFRRKTLFRWALGVALLTCLLVHGLVIWIVFKYVLAAFDHFSPLLWLPFMLIQIFALLVWLSEDRTGIDRQT